MGFWPHSQPRVGLNIGASSIGLVRLKGRGKQSQIHRYKVHKVLPHIVMPSPTERNIQDPGEFKKVLQKLFLEEGIQRKPISLSLPDLAVKVLLIKFDHIPKKKGDLEQLIRWNMEKTFLSPLQEAHLSYQILDQGKGKVKGCTVLASMIQRDILFEYEDLIRSIGCFPVLIDISSFHVFNLFREILLKEVPWGEEFLFVNVCDANFTVMIFNQGLPDFIRIKGFRDRSLSEQDNGGFRVEKIIEEIETSFRFYNRTGNKESLKRIYLFGESQTSELVSPMESRFNLRVKVLDPQTSVAMNGFSSLQSEEVPVLIPALAAAIGR